MSHEPLATKVTKGCDSLSLFVPFAIFVLVVVMSWA